LRGKGLAGLKGAAPAQPAAPGRRISRQR